MFGECAGNFLNLQEFQAKCKNFLAQLAHVQEEYEEALNSSCTFAGMFPTLFPTIPTHFKILPAHF